ncbi:MAG: hypothetical protein ACP5O3_00945 [Candidatus Micrarchaeia archaeon]|jgi:hypothetical protein
MKKLFPVFLLVAVFASVASAAHLKVIAPTAHEIQSGDYAQPVEIGVVGPGQKVEISIERGTGQMSNDKTTFGQEAIWDRLEVIRSSLPSGWDARDSLVYETPLTAFVIVSPEASDGEYVVEMQSVDEYEGVAPIKFKAKIRVARDAFSFSMNPSSVIAGVGQPAVYSFKLKSNSDASDAYQISAEGLPYNWGFTKSVFLPRRGEAIVAYEVVGSSQKQVSFNFRIRSLSSSLIEGTQEARLVTVSSLWQDMKAAASGIPLFPSAEQPIHSLLGFTANLFP